MNRFSHWVAKRSDVLAATPDKTLEAWAPLIAGQSAVLFEAGGELAEVAAAATRKNIRPDAPAAAPFRDVLEAYAVAIGEAHDSENPHARVDQFQCWPIDRATVLSADLAQNPKQRPGRSR